MKRVLPVSLLLISLFSLSSPLSAAQYQVIQGDVLTIHRELPEGAVKLECFGKSWPVSREPDGKVWAWIGVDLKTKIKSYPLIWKSNSWQTTDELTVRKGKFRISPELMTYLLLGLELASTIQHFFMCRYLSVKLLHERDLNSSGSTIFSVA